MSAIPYVVGQWVRGTGFYGRGPQIAEVLEGPRNAIWLLGTRRIGKTSLLKQLEYLAASATEPVYFPVFWDFQGAENARELHLNFDEMRALPTSQIVADIHCVTKWSKFDTEWEGVAVTDLLDRVGVGPAATHVLVRAEHGFTANLPLDDFARDQNLFAWRFGGDELELDHGWPLRLVVPHLYFWKSVKWVRGFDLLDYDEPGFWERNGYHMYGDPFREQRYWGD